MLSIFISYFILYFIVGPAGEDTPGIQETLSVQMDSNATSSSNDVTSFGAEAVGNYNVKTETWGEIDMTNNSFYLDSEPLLEVEPIDIAPYKVDFVAKFDSSCDPSSNLIWPTNGNTQSPKKLMFSFNKLCAEIVGSEENLYFPENGENNLPESKIMDAEAGANPVGSTGNASDSKNITCCLNRACIDDQSEESWYSLGNSQGSLHDNRITEVESNVSPATTTGKIRTDENLCLFKEVCMNDVETGENLYSPESTHNSSLQSEMMKVQDGPSAVAIKENIKGGKDLISSCNEARSGDVESGGDLYSPEGSQNTLNGSEVTEAQSDATPVTEISPGGEGITSSSDEECNGNSGNEENVYSPKNCQNNSGESGNAQVEASKNPFMVTDTATDDALANTHTGNGSSDDYGLLCEGVPNFLDTTSSRSSEGHLESIVFSAISTSKCFYNKEDDTSTSVHRALISPTENSETDSNSRKGAVTNFDEVYKGSNQVQSTEVTEREISGGLQLSDNLEKRQSTITENEGAKLENEVEGDQRTTRVHAPIKLLSNRTVCSLYFLFLVFFFFGFIFPHCRFIIRELCLFEFQIISPTSQEKLCRAITEIDLCEGAQISSKPLKLSLFSLRFYFRVL